MKMQMARHCGSEKWDALHSDDEEEALSLCDLPISLTKKDNESRNEEANQSSTPEEEFNFSSLDLSHSTEPGMCTADEVFFKGQILPLRLSVSSENGSGSLRHSSLNPSRCNSRSESMDHYRCPSFGFTSNSSRSSSTKSHNSWSSTNTITTATPSKATKYKPVIRNQFHAHPSPKPQIRNPSIRHGNAGGRSRKSSTWDFFRLGLVRTPEIELHDLKARTNYNNNNIKGFGSRNSSSGSSVSNDGNHSVISVKKKEKKQKFFDKDKKGLLSGCKCSADAVETVSSRIVIIKTNSGTGNYENETQALKEKLLIMKEHKQRLQQKYQPQDGKQAMSHHRTFEWLKGLSIEGGHEEA